MIPHREMILGSRGSLLAMTQSEAVAQALRAAWPDLSVRIQKISTSGDKITDVPLSKVGIKGIFTREIDLALARGQVHAAVHSMKDVPTQLLEGISLSCIPEREDPHDAILTRDAGPFDALPKGAVVGTSSLRRRAQLLAWRPDLQIIDLRGNVDTRLRKLDQGQAHAIVLARAGLSRLKIDRPYQTLPYSLMIPAPGQGALAITTKTTDSDTPNILRPLHEPMAEQTTLLERELLARLGGGCQLPFGAIAEKKNSGEMHLRAAIGLPDGSLMLRAEASGTNHKSLLENVLCQLAEKGLPNLLKNFPKLP